ncbi:thiamine pyrophosphate-dependent enzyme [Bordetella sp. BOR01]|uniref:thiamine pyrophosphate-dependent enzyme n=1 Tax=Bordetella sp. BOR01 TaxID=2854779 RepID=UPI001C4378FE|nr:thiamine pyrophosphate-dependent enzyme [Bordetella sp. BOR01]MBV7483450.1 thiamine monophosphate synthase [Bordetella sp. BOR01]
MTNTGGQALVAGLIRNGVSDLFMIPGIQLDWAVDALRQHSGEIKLYVPRHEQATTYMADGYYRACGQVGAAMVVPGPGALNAGAGLATAYASNSKVLFVTGQIHSAGVGKGLGLLHEIKDQTGFVGGLTKWNTFVNAPQQIGDAVDEAFAQVHAGRPRPVGIEIPHDYLSASLDKPAARQARHASSMDAAPALDDAVLARAAAILNAARLPVIYVGGGIFQPGGCAALQELAERIGAPVVMSDNGRGALSDRHPLAMNALAGRAVFQHADAVLVVGSRFIDALTPTPSWPAKAGLRFIHINIDAADLAPPRAPDVAIVADAASALAQLAERLSPRVALAERDALRVKAWAQAQVDAVMPQSAYVAELRAAMPDDAIFVNELTQIGYLARIALPVYGPGTYIGPGYQGTLGYGFPVALGAAVGGRGRRVVSITGDGGFGWNLQELATAQRYGLPVTLVVFNDGHYGNVRAIQKREFGAEVAVELANPDFALLARAFGVPFEQVDTPQALGAAVKATLAARGPAMIEVRIGVVPSPWHLLRLQPMKGMTGPAAPANPLDEA